MRNTTNYRNLCCLLCGVLFVFTNCTKPKEVEHISITTADVTGVTDTSAKSGGTVLYNGGSSIFSRGVCWGTNAGPTPSDNKTLDGIGDGSYTSAIQGLKPNTKYYVRAYAQNLLEIGYGNEISFTTPGFVPLISTLSLSGVTLTSAKCGGRILKDGGYPITDKGICWGTSATPTIANNKISAGTDTTGFVSTMQNLAQQTSYYVRAYATNSLGTGYGSAVMFETNVDNDGNAYHSVTIGTQVWMLENLKTTHFNDGTEIPNVTDENSWKSMRSPAYCWYSNNEKKYKDPYGALYNWYTVNTGKLCPAGWHVPSDDEWNTLVNYLGGDSVAGGKLKETGRIHWHENMYATNQSGFTALPGGARGYWGYDSYYGLFVGYWWSSTQIDIDWARGREIWWDENKIQIPDFAGKFDGMSVRCIKN